MKYYKQELSKWIGSVLKIPATTIEKFLEVPNHSEHGDYALPCFNLSKILKQSPIQISNYLQDNLTEHELVDHVITMNGYLNISLKKDQVYQYIMSKILVEKDKYGSSLIGVGQSVFLEHTSINPNASPHVGRARNALIGDFIKKILCFQGYTVDVHYFVNDIGKQIAMLLLGSMAEKNVTFKSLLDIYVAINKKAKDNPELEKDVFKLLYQLEQGDETVVKSFRNLVDICIEGQSKIFKTIGVNYDVFDYESDYIWSNRTDAILEDLKKTGYLFEDELGRYVMNLESFGLSYLVVTRHDKTSLYPLRDIAYSIDKAKSESDRNIIVLGEDQKLYFEQVKQTMALLGYQAPEVVHYAFVLLTEGSMSTRQGNVVLLEDLMVKAVDKAKEKLKDHQDDVSESIAYGAIKYAMLKTSNDRNVTFDTETALSFEGESAPYIQYNYVRIMSILEKVDGCIEISNGSISGIEYNLIKVLAEFPQCVSTSSENLSPHSVSKYLYKLTKIFSTFYYECPVIDAENQVNLERVKIIKAVKQVMENAMYILGISTVNNM